MALGTEEQRCPMCGASASASSISCSHCGANMRTGESFHSMGPMRQRIKPDEKEIARMSLVQKATPIWGAILLVMVVGAIYQQRVAKAQDQDMFHLIGWIGQVHPHLVSWFGWVHHRHKLYVQEMG